MAKAEPSSSSSGAGSRLDSDAPTSPQPIYAKLTEFTGHDGAVYTRAFSPDGKLVATGGYDKLVMIWNPDEVQPVDIAKRLEGKPDPKAELSAPGRARRAGAVASPFRPTASSCSAAARTTRSACGTSRPAKR